MLDFMYMCMFAYMNVLMYVQRQAWPSVGKSVPVMHEFPCMFICIHAARHVRAHAFVFASV